MNVEQTTSEESGLDKTPKAIHKIKPNELALFEIPFAIEGVEYNAISQREDGALVIFDYKAPKKEEK